MSTAQKLLVGYGLIVLTYGFVLGVPLAVARTKASAAPRHLVVAHLSGLMQGPIHVALAVAIGMVSFDSRLAVTAASLLIAGSVAEMLGGTINWVQGTGDQFEERSLGFRVNALSGLLAIPGSLIITVVVLNRL